MHGFHRPTRRTTAAAALTLGVLALAVTGMQAAYGAWSATTANLSTLATTTLVAPTGLTATASGRSDNLAWTLPPATGQGNAQLIQQGINGVAPATIATVGQTATTASIGGLLGDTLYCYDVVTADYNWMAAGAQACPPVLAPLFADDSGGVAAGYYTASGAWTGKCKTQTTTSAINTAQVTVPAPQAVYQTGMTAHGGPGVCTLVISGFTPGATYQVRFQLCEIQFTTAGSRLTTADINGVNVLNNFDIFANAGGQFIAITRTFTTTATATGTITITLHDTNGTQGSMVNGVEVL